MELGVGARALGMGNAFISLAEDATSFYWNPAGMTGIKKNELFLMHSRDFNRIFEYNTVSYATSSIGIALYQIRVDSILINPDTLPGISPSEPEKIVDVFNYTLYLSYAKRFSNSLSLGINLKGIWLNWNVGTAYGFGTDFGVLFNLPFITLGLNFVNVGGTYLLWKHGTKEYILPLLKTGASSLWNVPLLHGEFVFAMGLDTDIENRMTELSLIHSDTHIGAEYWYKDKTGKRLLALRLGKDRGGNCIGIGLVYRNFKLDYALKFIEEQLGTTKRLSGSISW